MPNLIITLLPGCTPLTVSIQDVDMADVKENGHHQGNGDNNGVAGEAEGEESNDSGPGLEGIIIGGLGAELS